MKRFLPAIILIVLLMKLSFAQNLVSNPSFEQEISKSFKGDKGSWLKCIKSDTPDYFSFSGDQGNIFNSYIGGIEPHSGSAFVGIFTYRRTKSEVISEVREFIQCPLLYAMKKDSTYLLEFYVALDSESNIAIDGLGAFFSENKIDVRRSKDMYQLKPQIVNASRQYLDQINQWMKISGEYIAKGDEKYLCIGNFYPDERCRFKKFKKNGNHHNSKQEKWNLKEGELAAYYYIDDVTLVEKLTEISQDSLIVESMVPDLNFDTLIDTSIGGITSEDQLKEDQIIVLENILFEFDKSILLEPSKEELNKLINFMQKYHTLEIEIMGHTDNIGSSGYNLELSEARAKSVYSYLYEMGIAKERLSYRGFGNSKPVSDNISEEGRKKNRRVEIKIIKK